MLDRVEFPHIYNIVLAVSTSLAMQTHPPFVTVQTLFIYNCNNNSCVAVGGAGRATAHPNDDSMC